MNRETIEFRRYKVHSSTLNGKEITEYPARHNWEDVEIDVQRAKNDKAESVVIYEAKEIRIFI